MLIKINMSTYHYLLSEQEGPYSFVHKIIYCKKLQGFISRFVNQQIFWYVLCSLKVFIAILKVYWADAPNKHNDSEEDVSARYFNNKRIILLIL